MHPNKAQQIFNLEFQKKLKDELFPDALLPFNIDQVKHLALQTESPVSVAIPFPEYKVFMMKKAGYTLFEAAQLFNIIERKSPKDLPLQNYYDIQEAVYKAGEEWKKLTNPIREAVEKKVEIMANNVGGRYKEGIIKKLN